VKDHLDIRRSAFLDRHLSNRHAIPKRITCRIRLMAKTSETDLGLAVMRFLATRPGNEAIMRTIIRRLPDHIALTNEDHESSGVRRGEEMWEQRVRNLKSHDKTPGNVLAEGFVERPARGHYRLTPVVLSHLQHNSP
jgi:hypothetical protein